MPAGGYVPAGSLETLFFIILLCGTVLINEGCLTLPEGAPLKGQSLENVFVALGCSGVLNSSCYETDDFMFLLGTELVLIG